MPLRAWLRSTTALARETYLEAFAAAIFDGVLGNQHEVREVAAAALAAPMALQPPDPISALVRGLATAFTEGFAVSVPPLRIALEAFRGADDDATDVNRWLWLACRMASDLWDDQLWDELADRGVRIAREAGALSVLPIAASYRAGVHLHAGEFATASGLMQESAAITQMTGTAPLIYTPPLLAAYCGDEASAVPLLEAAHHDAIARGQGLALSMIECSRAVLFNGLGRYEDAVTAAEPAFRHDGLGLYALTLVELGEAAVRSGRAQLAAAALDRLAERTRASNTDWALGIEARSRALLTEGPAAEALYEEAVTRLTRGRVALHPARARLLYGANGSAARTVEWTPASSWGPPTTCSTASAPRPSLSAPAASSWPPASPRPGAPRTRSACSRPRKRRSPGWQETG